MERHEFGTKTQRLFEGGERLLRPALIQQPLTHGHQGGGRTG